MPAAPGIGRQSGRYYKRRDKKYFNENAHDMLLPKEIPLGVWVWTSTTVLIANYYKPPLSFTSYQMVINLVNCPD